MSKNGISKLVALFILGLIIFNYPFFWLVGTENNQSTLAYFFIFSVWLIFILLIWLATEIGSDKEKNT